MTRTMVIAHTGRALADLTAALEPLRRVGIVRYAHARTHVDAVARVAAPDLVLIDQGCGRSCALQRALEVQAAAPAALVVLLQPAEAGGWASAARFGGPAPMEAGALDAPALRAALLELLAQPVNPPRVPALAAA